MKVHVTTEAFMSEVRSWPARQISGWPTVAVTDKLNTLIFIRSKTPLYLITTDQSAPSTDSVPTLLSSLLSRFWWEQHEKFQSQPTHPSTDQVLSMGESTPHILALVQCTLKKRALKHKGYITMLMWPPQPETKLNHPYNLVCIGKIRLPLRLTRFGLELPAAQVPGLSSLTLSSVSAYLNKTYLFVTL